MFPHQPSTSPQKWGDVNQSIQAYNFGYMYLVLDSQIYDDDDNPTYRGSEFIKDNNGQFSQPNLNDLSHTFFSIGIPKAGWDGIHWNNCLSFHYIKGNPDPALAQYQNSSYTHLVTSFLFLPDKGYPWHLPKNLVAGMPHGKSKFVAETPDSTNNLPPQNNRQMRRIRNRTFKHGAKYQYVDHNWYLDKASPKFLVNAILANQPTHAWNIKRSFLHDPIFFDPVIIYCENPLDLNSTYYGAFPLHELLFITRKQAIDHQYGFYTYSKDLMINHSNTRRGRSPKPLLLTSKPDFILNNQGNSQIIPIGQDYMGNSKTYAQHLIDNKFIKPELPRKPQESEKKWLNRNYNQWFRHFPAIRRRASAYLKNHFINQNVFDYGFFQMPMSHCSQTRIPVFHSKQDCRRYMRSHPPFFDFDL